VADARPRCGLFLRNLSQRHAGTAGSDNLPAIYIQPRPTDLATFKSRPSNSTFHPLHDE
jgi:hypothetical protein